MRFVLVGAIRIYQVTLSGLIGNTCRFQPTCSRYAEEAILRHGPIWGIWLTLKRLARCRPGGPMGFDPVPE